MTPTSGLPYEKIIRSFSEKSAVYDNYSAFQSGAANILADYLPPELDGSILEIGAGTGYFTRHLVRKYPTNEILATDASQAMIDVLGGSLYHLFSGISNERPYGSVYRQVSGTGSASGSRISYGKPSTKVSGHTSVVDSDFLPKGIQTMRYDPVGEGALGRRFSLVASAMTAQWFPDFEAGIEVLASMVDSGGMLLFSSLNSRSFPQWRRACDTCRVKLTMNKLPNPGAARDTLIRNGFRIVHREISTDLHYASAVDFFRSLRGTGASTQVAGIKNSGPDMRRIMQAMDRIPVERGQSAVTITYHYDITAAIKTI